MFLQKRQTNSSGEIGITKSFTSRKKTEVKLTLEDITYHLPSIRKSQIIEPEPLYMEQSSSQFYSSRFQTVPQEKQISQIYNKCQKKYTLTLNNVIGKEKLLFFLRHRIETMLKLKSQHRMIIIECKNKLDPNILKQINQQQKELILNHRKSVKNQNHIIDKKIESEEMRQNIKKMDSNNKNYVQSHKSNLLKEMEMVADLNDKIMQILDLINNAESFKNNCKKKIKILQKERQEILTRKLNCIKENEGLDETVWQLKQIDQIVTLDQFPQFLDEKMKNFVFFKYNSQIQIRDLQTMQSYLLENFVSNRNTQCFNTKNIQLFENDKPIYQTENKSDYFILNTELQNNINSMIKNLNSTEESLIQYIVKEFMFKNYEQRYKKDIKTVIATIVGLEQFQKYMIKYSICK